MGWQWDPQFPAREGLRRAEGCREELGAISGPCATPFLLLLRLRCEQTLDGCCAGDAGRTRAAPRPARGNPCDAEAAAGAGRGKRCRAPRGTGRGHPRAGGAEGTLAVEDNPCRGVKMPSTRGAAGRRGRVCYGQTPGFYKRLLAFPFLLRVRSEKRRWQPGAARCRW